MGLNKFFSFEMRKFASVYSGQTALEWYITVTAGSSSTTCPCSNNNNNNTTWPCMYAVYRHMNMAVYANGSW